MINDKYFLGLRNSIKHILFLLCVFGLVLSCTKQEDQESSQKTEGNDWNSIKTAFQDTLNGKETDLFVLENNKGVVVTITNYGARVVHIVVPDKTGKPTDISLGYNSLKEYLDSPSKYYGALIGRYANRIADGAFEIDGIKYELAKNNGKNSLHGGPGGLHNVVWDVVSSTSNSVELLYTSPDGEEGFPGNLDVTVIYNLNEENGLEIYYQAMADKKTVVNLTNHAYFNLNGDGSGDVNKHVLQVDADEFTPVDSTLIPLGEHAKVDGTPFDFRAPTAIGQRIEDPDVQLQTGGGYDHNFVLNKGQTDSPEKVATVYSPESGIQMEVYTTEPGVQFYGGNFMNGLKGKNGNYEYRGAFCLETQHFPDSPNQPSFPTTILEVGDVWESATIYKFMLKSE